MGRKTLLVFLVFHPGRGGGEGDLTEVTSVRRMGKKKKKKRGEAIQATHGNTY